MPEDNCVEIYSNDLGFLAIVEKEQIVGYNVLVGGGMGVTPSAHKTFPAVAKRLAFVTPEQVVGVAEAIVKVQRDFGNREDRKVARLKYLIANWGVPAFKAKVEEYFGQSLADPHPADVTDVDDHIGWHEQGDGKLFLGVNVECGRLKDEGDLRIKSAVRLILEKYGVRCRLTPHAIADLLRPRAGRAVKHRADPHRSRRQTRARAVAVATAGDRLPRISDVRTVDHRIGTRDASAPQPARGGAGPPGHRRTSGSPRT